MPITDAFGSWINLGTVAPTDEWQLFEEPIINSSIFRITYNTDWDAYETGNYYVNTALCRFIYVGSGDRITVSTSFRIFPKREAEIRRLDHPAEVYINGAGLVRDLSIRIFRPTRLTFKQIEKLDLTVTVEALA